MLDRLYGWWLQLPEPWRLLGTCIVLAGAGWWLGQAVAGVVSRRAKKRGE